MMNNDSSFLSSAASTPEQDQPEAEPSPFTATRRTFLSLTLAGCAAGCAALAGCGSPPEGAGGSPGAAGANATPLVTATRDGENWVVPGAGALTSGTALQFMAAGTPVFVIATADGLRAFSGRCTHLGCAVEWHSPEKRFVCPCHASKFDAAGKVLNGPAEKPLPAYSVKKKGSDAVVAFKA